ncbi:MAG: modulator protein [Ponticaulis sp.]|nr:modulator protein [Ponticaulis sp.]
MTNIDFGQVLDSVIERALKNGATSADAAIDHSTGVDVSVRNGQLETIERDDSMGIALRCFVGQKQAHVSGSDLSDDGLNALIDRCVTMAKIAPEDQYAGIAAPEELATDYPDIELWGDDPVEPEVLEAEAIAAEAAARAVPGVKDVPGSGSSWSVGEAWLAASNGFRAHKRSSLSGVGLSAIAERDGVMERDYDSWATRLRANRPTPEAIGKIAGERAVARLGAEKLESQKAAVMFDRRVSASLIGALIGAISGTAIARGTSFLKDKLGEKVFSSGVELIDEPFLALGLGSRGFDGEGRPVQVTKLIDDGVLTTWLLNGPSARQLGLKPNGFASSGFGDPPGITTSNLKLQPGSQSPEELIASAGKVLQITEMFGPSINPNTGDYSVGVSGVWHDGAGNQIPVSEITVADNLVDMFARLIPANDLQLRSRTNAPSLMIEDMTIAGR